MPIIKTKKEMTLPELIEWGWKNIDKVQSEIFISNVSDFFGNYSTVHFSVDGYGFKTDGVSHKDTFTVEIEEEVTEDTVIPKMLEKSFDAYQNVVLDIQVNQSINTVKENAEVLTLHVINDDDTHTLIWRDGKLVE